MPGRHARWSVRGDLLIFFDAPRVKIRKDVVARTEAPKAGAMAQCPGCPAAAGCRVLRGALRGLGRPAKLPFWIGLKTFEQDVE
jgi:hypothetical protein